MMSVSQLRIECEVDGSSDVALIATCRNCDDIDDLILWLRLAQHLSARWRDHCKKRKPVPTVVTVKEQERAR